MKILKTVSELGRLPAGCVLTIGNFDGVHVGHRQNINVARDIAVLENTALAVMTFEPHPVAILHPEKAPGVLTPLPLKIRLIEGCCVDYLIVLRDTASLLRLSPADFVDKFLLKDVRPKALVEGDDFHFGAGRGGNVETLQQMAGQNGFDVVVVPAKLVRLPSGQSIRVSSTTIRYMLQSGHVADAAAMLGRFYRIIGRIVPGRGKGRQLGFPTLNMQIPRQIIPQQGVYAGYVRLGGSEEDVCRFDRPRPAVFSIGQATTFADVGRMLIEAHLLDPMAENPTADWMAMDFVKLIRTQHKFGSIDDLSAQIARDCESAGQILSSTDSLNQYIM
ncbi:MAG: riboflavin biosynthesis protein RibF [Sedimentisphaerales bacterium]|nr:riboflavin biosynthesis protein RibF [Sedimentisphaerales bacterium]